MHASLEIVHERGHPRRRKWRTEEERKRAEAQRQRQVAQRISSLVAQLLVPLTPLFSLPGLTEHWYVRRDASGFVVETKPDPPLIIAAGAVTLAVAILANLSIMSRLVDTQPRFFTFSTIFLLSVHCIINLIALCIFGVEHAVPDGYYLSTAFWLSAASGIVALVSIVALVVDGMLTRWYHEGGIGVTNKQRSLIVCFDSFVALLLIGSVCYRYLIDGANYLDTVYLCIQSFLTVGFGDVTLNTTGSQVFSLFLNTVGILNFALLVTFTRATALEAMEEQYKTQERIIAHRFRNRGLGSRLLADVLSFLTCGLVHSRAQQEEEQEAADERHEEEEHGSEDEKKDDQGDQRRYEDAIIELRKERDRETRSQIVVAFSLFLVFWLVGAAAFAKLEGWTYWIAFYFVYVMATSIGYGDYSPQTQGGRAFFCVWAIGGAGVLTVLFSILADAYSQRFKKIFQHNIISTAFFKIFGRPHSDSDDDDEEGDPDSPSLHPKRSGLPRPPSSEQESQERISAIPPSSSSGQTSANEKKQDGGGMEEPKGRSEEGAQAKQERELGLRLLDLLGDTKAHLDHLIISDSDAKDKQVNRVVRSLMQKEDFSRSNWEQVERNQDFKEFLYLRSLQAKLAELERLAQRVVGSSQDADESKPAGSGAEQEQRGEEVQEASGRGEKGGKERDVRGQAKERDENTRGRDPAGSASMQSWVGG